ncbi:MAG: double zinc ribbon domain-containing protein [Oscillospiraceae bacterium]
MERENYFNLLELPFDPPADTVQVRAAIHAKRQEWTRLQDVPGDRGVALRYLEMLPDIERVMLDDELRGSEVEDALFRRDIMSERLEAELRVMEGKGYLLPREFTAIVRQYRPYGIDREAVRELLQAPVTDSPPKAAPSSKQGKALDREMVAGIRKNQLLLDKTDLYDFLGLDHTHSPEELRAQARAMHRDAFHAQEKTAETSATQLLADYALAVFETTEMREQYDNYLSVSAYPELNALIDKEDESTHYISADVLLRLVNFGVSTYSARVLDMEEYIRRYCAAYGIPVDTPIRKVICPACRHEADADAEACPTCGNPLRGDCPQCGEPFSGGAAACHKCGFALGEMKNALEYLSQAEAALIDGSWSTARRSLEHAARYWPGHPKLEELQRRIADLEQRYASTVGAVEDAVRQNRYYAAREMAEEAASRQMRLPLALLEQIANTIKEFESRVERAKTGRVTYDALYELLGEVADSIELERLLAQYPPDPPQRLTAKSSDGKVLLSWGRSPSTGMLRYVVVRKERSVPLTAYDGDILYEGAENAFVDDAIPTLRTFYYSVFVKRGSCYSDIGAVAAAPVRIIPEIQNFRVVPADQGAQLSWDPLPDLKEVRVWRKLGGDAPERHGDGILLETSRLDGYTDMKLKNDIVYWYYVQAVYQLEGKEILSRGALESVVPNKLVSPIDQMTITRVEEEGDTYLANWEASPSDEVILLASRVNPPYHMGQMVAVSDLLFANSRLPVEFQSQSSARFQHRFSGGSYVFPAVVTGRYASVGIAKYLTNVPNVSNPTYDRVGDDLYLNFKWPVGPIPGVTVAWQFDRYPSSPDEAGSSQVYCTREQYDADAGVHIPDLTESAYYFRIFTAFEAPDGALIHSTGAELLFDNRPRLEVLYDIKYTKPLFGRGRTVSVTISSRTPFVMPKAVLVGRENRLPLSIADGQSLFEIDREQRVPGSITYEYATSKLPENLYLRLFFLDAEVYNRLRPIPVKSLRLT